MARRTARSVSRRGRARPIATPETNDAADAGQAEAVAEETGATVEELAGLDAGTAAEETGSDRRPDELRPELAALLKEAQESPLANDPAAAGAPAAAEPAATVEPEAFKQFAATAVMACGNYACDMFHVTRLQQSEAGMLAVALCDLAQAYDMLGQLDPKTAAWLSLAAVSAAVIGNRRRVEPQPEAANDPGTPAAQAA